jgi:hypothetical protein
MCHEMNNFLEGLKSQISTFCICADSLKSFCCLVMEKINFKVLAWFHETLINCENPSSNPLEIASCGIQEATCDTVYCSVMILKKLRYYFSKYQADY